MKPLIGLALTVGDVILFYAIRDSSRAHHLHGRTLDAYIAAAALSLVLWLALHAAWKKSRPKAAARPGGYPYGRSR